MCDIGYHICPSCSEEYNCAQSNQNCEAMNHYDAPCAKCEWWIEEERREQEKYERMMYERDEWAKDHNF